MSGGIKSIAHKLAVRGSAAVLALGLIIGPAAADALSDARAAGYIGERPDGYVALVDNGAPGDVRALVDQINSQRYAAYQNVASQTGAPIDQVGIIAAQRIYSEVPSGTFLLSQSGQWYRK
ncbi:MAG: YdbL family protein [Alphaproteobacteria bacterium]